MKGEQLLAWNYFSASCLQPNAVIKEGIRTLASQQTLQRSMFCTSVFSLKPTLNLNSSGAIAASQTGEMGLETSSKGSFEACLAPSFSEGHGRSA